MKCFLLFLICVSLFILKISSVRAEERVQVAALLATPAVSATPFYTSTGSSTGISAPDITPPDYSKNECPICDPGFTWMGNKGCCQFNANSSTAVTDYNLDCKQPNIVVCQSGGLGFCVSGSGCFVNGQIGTFKPAEMCAKLAITSQKGACTSCMDDGKHVWTGIGCLPIDLASLITKTVITLGIRLGGGISFLVLLYGSYLILTSQGDVERVKNGKKYATSAIKGLFLIIFAVFIVRFIGVTLLQIPGFR